MIISIILAVLLVTVWLLAVLYMMFISVSYVISDLKGAPFVPNDDNVIRTALKLLRLSSKDVLVDLGSGNGKVLFEAVKNFEAKNAVGYEISPWPFLLSILKRRRLPKSVQGRIKLHRKSIFNADLNEADVVYVYLFPKLLKKLAPMLLKAKRENRNLRIVSCVFQ